MKWTDTQTAELKAMCFNETPNAQIAEHFGVTTTEIHAKRSQLGITIPKVRAAKDNPPLMTSNQDFKAASQEAEKRMPIHAHGLGKEVRVCFHAIQDAILLAMARNGTSLEAARTYNCLGQTLSAIEEAYDGLLRDAQ